jgi:hypothetical protein
MAAGVQLVRAVATWSNAAAQKGAYVVLSLAGRGVSAVASKALAPAVTVATWIAAPALYTWWPIKSLADKVAAPAAETAISALGFSVPIPAQMILAFAGYEKAKKYFWSKELDLKRTAIATILTWAVTQDPTAQRIVRAAMTPTVLRTVGLCAAVDYLNVVAEEKKLIPSSVSDMANKTAQKVKTICSMASAGARTAYAKAAASVGIVRDQAAAVATVAKEKWQAAPAA